MKILILLNYLKLISMRKELPTMLAWFFGTLVVIMLMSSCVSIRPTCPSTDAQYFYKQAGVKPYYHRR